MAEESVKVSALIIQSLAALSIAYLTSLTAFVYAWPSYTLENLMSNGTVLSRPMTTGEISILGSIPNIGALVVTPFCGYAVDTLGRKLSALIFGLPFMMAWLIVSLTTSVSLVIAAMGIAGVGGAGLVVSSVYICEIVQDSIRGALSSTLVSGYFAGLLFSYFIGGQLSYHGVAYTHLGLSVLYFILIGLLRESPVYLVQKGKITEASKSIAFYRRVKETSKVIEIEINKIKLQLDPRIDKLVEGETELAVTEELIINNREENISKESPWKFLKNSISSRRALACVLILMPANVFMGNIIFQVYAEPLFKEVVPSMPSNLCSILLAINILLASIVCGGLVDRFGRRGLMISTSVLSGVFTIAIGAQLSLHFGPEWFTAILIYSYSFVINLGVTTVPYILTAEVFLPEVRGICSSMSIASIWLSNFLTLIVFQPLLDLFGLSNLFYGFFVVCVATTLYSHFYLPETKGLSADAIQPLFLRGRVTRNSRTKA